MLSSPSTVPRYDHAYFYTLVLDTVRISMRLADTSVEQAAALSQLHDELIPGTRRLWESPGGERFDVTRIMRRSGSGSLGAGYVDASHGDGLRYYHRLQARRDGAQVWALPHYPTAETPQLVVTFHPDWCRIHGNDLAAFHRRSLELAGTLSIGSARDAWLSRLDIACDTPVPIDTVAAAAAKGRSRSGSMRRQRPHHAISHTSNRSASRKTCPFSASSAEHTRIASRS